MVNSKQEQVSMLQYGLRNGELVSVNDVPSGLKCGCICPHCGAKLEARKGERRKHHFAHEKNSVDCGRGCETALHLLAKKVLKEHKSLAVPMVKKTHVSKELRLHDYEYVDDEVFLNGDLKPDIVMKSDEDTLYVEILVTHEVDSKKLFKYFNIEGHVVEINLSELVKRDYDENTVWEIIRSGSKTTLLFDPSEKEYFLSLWLYDCKSIFRDGDGRFVTNCYLLKQKKIYYEKYIYDSKIHKCQYCFRFCRDLSEKDNELVCSAKLEECKLCDIKRIEEVKKIENEVIYYKLLLEDNSVLEKDFSEVEYRESMKEQARKNTNSDMINEKSEKHDAFNTIFDLCDDLDFQWAELYDFYTETWVLIGKKALEGPWRWGRMYGRVKTCYSEEYSKDKQEIFGWNRKKWSLLKWKDTKGIVHRR